MHQAARIVRRHHGATCLGDRVELPLGEPVGHARPLEAEAAAEAAAIGDVRQVDHLVARELEHAPGLVFQSQLAEGLAGVVVRDLEAEAVGVDELGPGLQDLEEKPGRVA